MKNLSMIRALCGGCLLTTGAAITICLLMDWAALGETSAMLWASGLFYAVITGVIVFAFDKLIQLWKN